jgi:hypothetical protein
MAHSNRGKGKGKEGKRSPLLTWPNRSAEGKRSPSHISKERERGKEESTTYK